MREKPGENIIPGENKIGKYKLLKNKTTKKKLKQLGKKTLDKIPTLKDKE
ncbi:hypothetical protein HYD60_03930 [Mycoplasmopsis bovis]|nr:hypothetical protein [Mycoplasmopsis bovis]QQH60696.1 hypothetical protein HYD60_03930 [Mycoplasmopsis bovis]